MEHERNRARTQKLQQKVEALEKQLQLAKSTAGTT
jgi:BMFP domain-containing protein YqiC